MSYSTSQQSFSSSSAASSHHHRQPQPHPPHHHLHHSQTTTSGSDSEPSSSGENASASPSFLSSSMSSLWGGLLRRFSSDGTNATAWSQSGAPHHLYHFDGGSDPNSNGVDGVYMPPRLHRAVSPIHLPPLEPLSLQGFRDDTAPDARLLNRTIAEEIRIMVPARLSIVDEWNLVYSLDQDGASLNTLYDKCRRYEGKRVGFVLVVKDRDGGIFGAYLSDFPHPAPKYFGTGECFLWRASVMASLPPPPSADTTHLTGRTTTIANPAADADLLGPDTNGTSSSAASSNGNLTVPQSPAIRFKAFPYSGVNEYYMLCEAHFLSVGAGDGKYGLWLDDGLTKGVSSTCLTFGNEKLSDEGEKFGVLGVEVWVIGAAGP